MRRPIIAGNWKMNLVLEEAIELARKIREKTEECNDVDILLFPPSPFLQAVVKTTMSCYEKLEFGQIPGKLVQFSDGVVNLVDVLRHIC